MDLCAHTITVSIPAGCVVGVEVGSDGALSVELKKSAAGLGFSLDGGKASAHGDRPLYIKRVFRGEFLTLKLLKMSTRGSK